MQALDVIWLVVRTVSIQLILGVYIAVFLAQYSGGAVFAWFLALAIGLSFLSVYLLRWIPDSPAYSSMVTVWQTAVWVLPVSYLQVTLPPLMAAAAYSWADLTVIVFLALFVGGEVFFLAQSLLQSKKSNAGGTAS